jgi:hypothetical protein
MVVRSFSAEDSSKHLSSEGKLAAAQPLHSAALDRVSAFAACSRPSGSQPHIHHATASRQVAMAARISFTTDFRVAPDLKTLLLSRCKHARRVVKGEVSHYPPGIHSWS